MLSLPHWKKKAAAGNIDPSALWGTINDRRTRGSFFQISGQPHKQDRM